MKAAIIYASVHHGNTKKVVEAIAGENVVDLIDATKEKERDLSGYDLIGFASGVYYGKFHQTVLNFASASLPANRNVFLICTCGGSAEEYNWVEPYMRSKQVVGLDFYSAGQGGCGCTGVHDTSVDQFMADTGMKFRILEEPLQSVDLGGAFDREDTRGINAELTKVLAEMQKDGTTGEIIGNYLLHPENYLEDIR